MFNANFYPTPAELVNKMLAEVDLTRLHTILEPSAGKGDILDVLVERFNSVNYRTYKHHPADIDTIEIEPELRHILIGKGYRVVHDDFLRYAGKKKYDLIIMNPPFSEGDKHLLKAIELQRKGGTIVCLLNAETLKNPYSNSREELLRKLNELEAEVSYISGAFKGAERKTAVEVALIKVEIERATDEGVIITGLRQEEEVKSFEHYQNQVTSNDFVEAIVQRYNFEVKAGVKLLEEYFSMRPLVVSSFDERDYPRPILKLKVEGAGIEHNAENLNGAVNNYLKAVRYKYWSQLFQSKEFMNLLTNDLQSELRSKVYELVNYDFSHYNITEIKMAMSKKVVSGVEAAIVDLFDELSHEFSYYDGGNNTHYYDGWKTNKAWYINKRVIIRLNAFDGWGGAFDPSWKPLQTLSDIEKVFDYLDGGRTDHTSLKETLSQAKEEGQTRKIKLKYFSATFYKKGTCHIEFRDLELLKKFNLFGSQKKGWLPPSYGEKPYNQMDAEEKAVVDSFEGKESYEKVLKYKSFYLGESYNLPMLGSGA